MQSNLPNDKPNNSAASPQSSSNSGSSSSKDVIEVQGEIVESMPGAMFRVKLQHNHEILAVVSGKMRKNHIKILPGDSVTVHMTPYDLTKGRIVRRER